MAGQAGPEGGVRVGVDVGGTFTDVVVAAGGSLVVWKLPSTPEDQSTAFADGVCAGLERAGLGEGAPVAVIAHGTTVATNALLERTGAVTAFVATEGFRDLLHIGRQDRPALYDLWADRPPPLVPRSRCIGVPERTSPGGDVVLPLDEEAVREAIERLAAAAPESVAVCLLFSFANPAHEARVGALVRQALPGARVSLSSRVLTEFREYERASTTVLDAYVGPVIERYVGRVTSRVAHLRAPVVVMRSGGSTMSAARAAEEPVHTLLSGPAAGVRGAVAVAKAAGFGDVVTFDMGGTSTDVCLVEGGEPDVAAESSVGGLPFRTPSLAVHTVGAGGGSVLWLDPAGALRAGPRSAGAVPGPACYGRGGQEPAVTDAHVVLGHLDPASFLGGRARLDEEAATKAVARLAKQLGAGVEEVALAGLAAVRAHMSKAIRVVSVERGRHPRDFALVAFGGAGPMHATRLAAELEMDCVLIPPAAGVLSALGLLATPLAADASLTHPMVDPAVPEVEDVLEDLAERATVGLRDQGAEPAGIVRVVDCRYKGQWHEVPVPADPPDGIAARFAAEHRRRFGWDAPGEPVEVVTLRVQARGPLPEVAPPELPPGGGSAPAGRRTIWTPGGPVEALLWRRGDLGAGDRLAGPCIVAGEESTAVLDAGWEAEVDPHGLLVARRAG
jgi:N-methylhydantoinase A